MAEEQKYPEVPAEKLRWRCPPDSLPFETTNEIKPCLDIIGQERALRAIRLGLEVDSLGYNIFVVGLVGTGRNTTIKCLLEEIDKTGKIPDDICYVNNFKDPDQPKCVYLPAGQGKVFKKDAATTWICRNCGYHHEGTDVPEMCPTCLHPKSYFELWNGNY